MTSIVRPVKAVEFEGKENKYIELCSSSTLKESQQKTCKEFNVYLKNKNSQIKKDIEETKADKKETEMNISELTDKISQIDNEMAQFKKEIKYLYKSIENKEAEIKEKQELLKSRLYAMQTSLNSNVLIDYLFGSASLTDFFMRSSQIKDITSYENELIDEMNEIINELNMQKQSIDEKKQILEVKKKEQEKLQNEYLAKLQEQNSSIYSMNASASANIENIDKINKNLAALEKASEESKVSNVSEAVVDKKPSKPSKPESKPETPSKPSDDSSDSQKPSNGNDSSSSDNGSSEDKNEGNTGDEGNSGSASEEDSIELGLKIANKALTRQGYMYVWGGAHTMSSIMDPNWTQFDCSGLVNWAHYQAGVNIGVQYTGSLVYMGKRVERDDLQAGDIILFSDNGSTSGVHHVGIYIGGNKMVHAPATGKPVQVASLSNAYWQREWLVARRLY